MVDEAAPSDAQQQLVALPKAAQLQQQQQQQHLPPVDELDQAPAVERDAAEALRPAALHPFGQAQQQQQHSAAGAAGAAAGVGTLQLGLQASSGSVASMGSTAASMSASGSAQFSWGSGAVPGGLGLAHSESYKPLHSFAFTNADHRLAALRGSKAVGASGEVGESAAATVGEEQGGRMERVVYDSITFPSVQGFQQQQQQQGGH
jgi:hypothetical protein